jgi:hypothetical protein
LLNLPTVSCGQCSASATTLVSVSLVAIVEVDVGQLRAVLSQRDHARVCQLVATVEVDVGQQRAVLGQRDDEVVSGFVRHNVLETGCERSKRSNQGRHHRRVHTRAAQLCARWQKRQVEAHALGVPAQRSPAAAHERHRRQHGLAVPHCDPRKNHRHNLVGQVVPRAHQHPSRRLSPCRHCSNCKRWWGVRVDKRRACRNISL